MFRLVCALVLAVPLAAAADTPFDGIWKADPAQVTFSARPTVLRLAAGRYECATCVPPVRVLADGQAHAVRGQNYDTIAVEVVDARTVDITTRKAGAVVSRTRSLLAEDGLSHVRESTNTLPDGTTAVTSRTWERVGAGRAGEHALSGSWRAVRINAQSDAFSTFEIDSEGDRLHLKTFGGIEYRAVIGGPAAPVTGDPGADAVRVTRPAARTMLETSYREGRRVFTSRMDVAPDGATARVRWHNLRTQASGSYVVVRQ